MLPLFLVIDLNVRRNQPQCSNFALNIRTRQSHCGSCRAKDGRCRGTNGNSSYIFSAEKCTFIIKYSKVWKWCRTFSANFFDLNVRHLTCLRSFCVEQAGQLPHWPGGKQEPQVRRAREQLPGPLRDRQSTRSFALSIPAPAQLAQVDEHSM